MLAGSLFGGAVIGVGGPQVGLLFTGALGALFLLFLPAQLCLWLLFIVALLIVGLLDFFAYFQRAFWVPFLMGMVLMVKVPLELLRVGNQNVRYARQIPMFLIALYLFFALFLFSGVLNETSALSMLVASKNYLFAWSIMFLIGLGAVSERSLENLWRFFLWVGVLQFPFAAIQRVFFASGRFGGLNWDVVVGTFGGNPDGGGASGAMALYLVFAMLLASSLYSAKRISGVFHWTVLACALGTIALAEVKVVFLILPIGYMLLFRKQIPHNLGRTLLAGTLLLMALAGVFHIYRTTMYGDDLTAKHSVSRLEDLFSGESNIDYYNPRTREVSRIGALVRWRAFNPLSEPVPFLFGHGPGEAHESRTIGIGKLVRNYPFSLSTSTASRLLWELGLIGYATFALVLLAGALSAERAARNDSIPEAHQLILRANGAVLLLLASMTIYNLDAIESAPIQFLIAAMIGHLLFLARKYSAGFNSIVSGAPAGVGTRKTSVAVS